MIDFFLRWESKILCCLNHSLHQQRFRQMWVRTVYILTSRVDWRCLKALKWLKKVDMKPTIVEIGFGNWFDDLLFKRELKLILEIDSYVKKKKETTFETENSNVCASLKKETKIKLCVIFYLLQTTHRTRVFFVFKECFSKLAYLKKLICKVTQVEK